MSSFHVGFVIFPRLTTVVAEIAGESVAQGIQLGIEYDPAPPFDAGHPDRAPAAVRAALAGRYEKAVSSLRGGIEGALAAAPA
jgi:cyclohexyl-isocyanide hydratase